MKKECSYHLFCYSVFKLNILKVISSQNYKSLILIFLKRQRIIELVPSVQKYKRFWMDETLLMQKNTHWPERFVLL